MKTKNFKRVLTIVLALAMVFTLSMVSFATGDGEVTLIVRNANYNLTTHQYNYTQLDSLIADIDTGDTVYDMLIDNYTPPIVWNPYQNVHFLEGITINNVYYEDVRVEAAASCYNSDDEYIGGNAIIDSLNTLPEFIACDGVYMSMAMLMEDDTYEGYYFMGDMEHMCSITYDWVYEVDFADDELGFVYPPNFTDPSSFSAPYGMGSDLWAMDECVLHDGDVVRLTYTLIWTIFE